MAYETIKYEVAEQVLTITLNRPDKLNAFNATMQQELIDAFDAADKDDNVRAIIVTGAGRGFCAGADLSSGADTFDRDVRRGPVKRLASGAVDYSDPQARDGGGQVTLRIFKCLKPVIAAVNGPAVGIGVTMQLAMDIRIASDAARFGFVFSQRGIVPEAASSWFLPRIVGISQALEWCYSGRVFPAQEALSGRSEKSAVGAEIFQPVGDLASAVRRAQHHHPAQSLRPISGEIDPRQQPAHGMADEMHGAVDAVGETGDGGMDVVRQSLHRLAAAGIVLVERGKADGFKRGLHRSKRSGGPAHSMQQYHAVLGRVGRSGSFAHLYSRSSHHGK